MTEKAERTTRAPKTRSPGKAAEPFALPPTVGVPAVLDDDGGDRAFRQLLYDLAIAATHLESAREYLARRLGVTSPQYNMLMVIAQYEGSAGLTVSDVAAHLHVSNTFVTTEIKKLERAGLVAKEANPLDARSVLLRLTPDGEARIQALGPDLLFVNNPLFRNISKEDFRHLSRIVASLIGDFAQTVAVLAVMGRAGPLAQDGAASPARRSTRKA